MSGRVLIEVRVNGAPYAREVEPRLLLVDFLRDRLALKSVRIGCDTSNCGCCTVLMDRWSVKACTLLAVQAHGREIVTLEGLSRDRALHPVPEAFARAHALQCGYCTSGMVMAAVDLLRNNPHPEREEVRRALAGNLCRCTGYAPILDAVLAAAGSLDGADPLDVIAPADDRGEEEHGRD